MNRSSGDMAATVTGMVSMNGTTDYVELYGYNGGGVTVHGDGSQWLSTFSGSLIASGNGLVGGGEATPGGSDTQVQFNDGGSALGGDSDWTWNKTTNVMTVAGDILYTGVVRDTSDRRLKSNIRALPSSLGAMLRLKPVSFAMNDNPRRTEYGLIAQDVEEVFPALVSTASDVSGTKSLNYVGVIAPTIKALQELKADNDNLRGELDELRREIRDLKNGVGYRRTGTR
jgi:trimeric autotransporter adhesin